jgi:hypothetical protein
MFQVEDASLHELWTSTLEIFLTDAQRYRVPYRFLNSSAISTDPFLPHTIPRSLPRLDETQYSKQTLVNQVSRFRIKHVSLLIQSTGSLVRLRFTNRWKLVIVISLFLLAQEGNLIELMKYSGFLCLSLFSPFTV